MRGNDRGPFGPEGRGHDVVVRCTLDTRGATARYYVQVLENGCFVAAPRGASPVPPGEPSPVESIHACGDPDLLEAFGE